MATFLTPSSLVPLELDFMLDAAEAVARSALAVPGSRAVPTRARISPTVNDERYLQHSLAYRTPEGPRIAYLPVTITRWAPEERKY